MVNACIKEMWQRGFSKVVKLFKAFEMKKNEYFLSISGLTYFHFDKSDVQRSFGSDGNELGFARQMK